MAMKFELSYTSKEITPWGGMVFLKQMLDKIGFRSQIESCKSLPTQNSNRGHSIPVLLESFIACVWCGANKFLHTEATRTDRALAKIFDWSTVPGNDAYKRYFGKFTQVTNQETGKHFFSYFFKNLQIDYFTLDIDSTIFTRYGHQEGSKVGYNPQKKGRKSHHPIIAFVNEVRLVANFWLRSGDAGSANNFVSFIEDTLSNFGDKVVGLIRLDSGFCTKEIMDYLEERQMKYIIAARFSHPIQRLIDKNQVWMSVDNGIEICNQSYQAASWEKPRRLVVVRRKVEQDNKALTVGKTLSLFPEDEIHRNYRYSAYFTNQEASATDVWRSYRARGDAEKHGKRRRS
jgi:hypothetical protein